MGNTFGFMRPHAGGGFKFSVLDACKAEGIDLYQTCRLNFGPRHELVSIGNITRGNLTARPDIAGQGVCQSPLFRTYVSILIRIDMVRHVFYVRCNLRRPLLCVR